MLVKREGIEAEKTRRRREIQESWERMPSQRKLLERHFPDEWAAIQRCRRNYTQDESRTRPGLFRVRPIFRCHMRPLCVPCVEAERNRSKANWLNAFAECTPAGKQPVFVHIVQASSFPDDGDGWGLEASRRPAAFRKMVFETVQRFYGDGVGCVMTYQDYGERGFGKRYPHIDFTVNGWAVRDGQPALLPAYELRNGGSLRWRQDVVARATRFRIDARAAPRDLDIEAATTGIPAYANCMKYQLREMVDLRKLEYDAAHECIYWASYRQPVREKIALKEWLAKLAEYRYRLGGWGRRDAELWGVDDVQELTAGYGTMADNKRKATRKLLGGQKPKHGSSCPCNECDDWEHVDFDEDRASAEQVARWTHNQHGSGL